MSASVISPAQRPAVGVPHRGAERLRRLGSSSLATRRCPQPRVRYLQGDLPAGPCTAAVSPRSGAIMASSCTPSCWWTRLALRRRRSMAADDQPHPAAGELRVQTGQFRCREALVVGQPFPGGRADEAVGEFHAPDGRRSKSTDVSAAPGAPAFPPAAPGCCSPEMAASPAVTAASPNPCARSG